MPSHSASWCRNFIQRTLYSAAATSEAAHSGLPLEIVLQAADWLSTGTFEKHHKETNRRHFAQSVLSSCKEWGFMYVIKWHAYILLSHDSLSLFKIIYIVIFVLCSIRNKPIDFSSHFYTSAPVLQVSVREGMKEKYNFLEGTHLKGRCCSPRTFKDW